MRRTLLPTALLAAAALAATPLADAAWSPPQSISSQANEASIGTLAINLRDRALLTWMPSTWDGRHFVATGPRDATRPPGAALFEAERRAPTFLAGPKLYASTRAVALGGPVGPWNRCGPRVDLQVLFGRADGAFPQPHATIAAFRATGGSWGPALDANDGGRVAAVWVQSSSDCRRGLVRFAERRGGGTGAFTRATTLRGQGENLTPSIAVDQGGDVVVAWARRIGEGRTAIEARYRRAGGHWGAVQRLGQGTVAAPVLAALSQNGRAYVVWQRSSISESTGLTASLYAAVKPTGIRGFHAATRLDGFTVPTSYIALHPALATAGNHVLVGWTSPDAGHWRVWVADTTVSGVFRARQFLSESGRDALLGDLALNLDGRAAVAWSHVDDEDLPADVMVSLRPQADVAFGEPEQVTAAQPRQLPRIALSTATGRPTVAWTENVNPPTHSAAKLDVRVRASQRSP